MLQCVNLQHHVKRGIVKQCEAFVQIELDHVDTALHAGQHIGIVNFYAVATATPRGLQVRQHGAVATSQVQHARATRHELRQCVLNGRVAHTPISCAMLSKYARTTLW